MLNAGFQVLEFASRPVIPTNNRRRLRAYITTFWQRDPSSLSFAAATHSSTFYQREVSIGTAPDVDQWGVVSGVIY
jgi:hypothetical protein